MATTAVGPPSGRREDGGLGREQLAERTVRRGPSGSEVREGLPLWSDFPGQTPKRTQKPEGPASTTSSSHLRACAPAGPHSLPAGERYRHVFKGLKSASAPGRRRLRGQLRRAVRPRGGSAPAPTVMGAVVAPTPQPDAQAVGACRNLFDAVGPVTGRAVPICLSTSCPVAPGRTRLLLTSRRPGCTAGAGRHDAWLVCAGCSMPIPIGCRPESPTASAYDLILMETDRAPRACINIYT
ncbi:hypothetical protein GGP92_000621 [Salinibacter ruber]|nr:hypothetical protein [Salinibacter ruber]